MTKEDQTHDFAVLKYMMQDFDRLSLRRATSHASRYEAITDSTSSTPLTLSTSQPLQAQGSSGYRASSLFLTDHERHDRLGYEGQCQVTRQVSQDDGQDIAMSNKFNGKQFSLFEGDPLMAFARNDQKLVKSQCADNGFVPWALDAVGQESIYPDDRDRVKTFPGESTVVPSGSFRCRHNPQCTIIYKLSEIDPVTSDKSAMSPAEDWLVNPQPGRRYSIAPNIASCTPPPHITALNESLCQAIRVGEEPLLSLSLLPTAQSSQFDDRATLTSASPRLGPFSEPSIDSSLLKDAEIPTRYLKVSNVARNLSIWRARDVLKSYGDWKGIFTMYLESEGIIFIEFFDIRHAMTASRHLRSSPTFGPLIDVQFCPKIFMCQVSPDILENENEGTLAVTVVAPRLSDSQLLHLISSYGHVRSFQADTDRWPLFAIVEYYDTRHAISAKMILQELRNKNQIQCQVSFYQKDRVATLKSGRQVEQHLQYGLQDELHRSPSSLDVLMAASRWLAAPEAIQRADCTSVSPTESNSSSGPFQRGIESLPIFPSPPDIIRGPQSPTSSSESHGREASTEIHKKIAPSTLSAGMVQDDAQERTKCQGVRSTEAVHDLSYASAVSPVTADPQVNKLTTTTAADKRTTFMIRNIPNKYTQQMLLECINETHFAMFDFLYLRMDFKNKCNVGYAFINFINTDVVSSFIKERVGKKWSRFNSDKICSLSYATIQGRSALVEKFRNSSVMNEEPSYRPKIFYVGGPNIGKEEPFPEPTVAKEGNQHNSRRRGPHGRVADY